MLIFGSLILICTPIAQLNSTDRTVKSVDLQKTVTRALCEGSVFVSTKHPSLSTEKKLDELSKGLTLTRRSTKTKKANSFLFDRSVTTSSSSHMFSSLLQK